MTEPVISPEVDGPFVGLKEDRTIPHVPGEVTVAENFYLDSGVYRGRTGARQLGATLPAAIQGIFGFEDSDGVVRTVAFSNGDMYLLNWGTETWVSQGLSGEGITISSTADISCAVLRGVLIATDGVNLPFSWDPSTDTYTTLSNAPIADDVTIYYSKVFFSRLPSAISDFEWSNEGDPTTGYTDFDQVWTFGQTDQGAINKVLGGNEALLVFKQDSISAVRGPVNDTFVSFGTREGLSETEGAIAQGAVIWVEKDVFFLSQYGLRVLPNGYANPVPLDEREGVRLLRDTWASVNREYWGNSLAAYDPNKRHVLFAVPTSSNLLDTVIVYSNVDGSLCVFKGWTVKALATVESTTGEEWVLIGTSAGKVLLYGEDDQLTDDGSTISYKLRSRDLWFGTPFKKRLTRIDVMFDPKAILTAQCYTVLDGVVGGLKNISPPAAGLQKYVRGMNLHGYGLGWQLYLSESGKRMDVYRIVARGTLSDDDTGTAI